MIDLFKQVWMALTQNSNKSLNYKLNETEIKFEKNSSILSKKGTITLCRLERNHHLALKTGHYNC